jgi:hypothetical protein
MCVANVGVKDCFEAAAAAKAHPEDGREAGGGEERSKLEPPKISLF